MQQAHLALVTNLVARRHHLRPSDPPARPQLPRPRPRPRVTFALPDSTCAALTTRLAAVELAATAKLPDLASFLRRPQLLQRTAWLLLRLLEPPLQLLEQHRVDLVLALGIAALRTREGIVVRMAMHAASSVPLLHLVCRVLRQKLRRVPHPLCHSGRCGE